MMAAGGMALAGVPQARAAVPERALAFYNLHTGESLKTVYWAEGRPVPGALAEIDRLLRDFRTSEVRAIDVGLLDLLHRVRTSLGSQEPFHVISGYRSPGTNAKLASHSSNVARRSLHVLGEAIDVRLPGRQLRDLHKAAVAQKAGGVGFYPQSDFVHIDVGRVRYW
jgi:uncharacterized protein YcbK (DUF882 family)